MRVYYPVLLQHSLYILNLFRSSVFYMGHETVSVQQSDTGRYCMEIQHDESNPHPEISAPPSSQTIKTTNPCSVSFCINAPCQYTQFLNLRPLIFGLRSAILCHTNTYLLHYS